MEKPEFRSRSAMPLGSNDPSVKVEPLELPASRAFVVRIGQDRSRPPAFRGRVEHVVSRRSTCFESVEELIEAISWRCAPLFEADSGGGGVRAIKADGVWVLE